MRVYSHQSNNCNGNTRDDLGRRLTCEHLTRSVVRHRARWYASTCSPSPMTASRLNSPNDVDRRLRRQRVVHRSQLRHHLRLRRPALAARAGWLLRLSHRSGDGRRRGQDHRRCACPTVSPSRPTRRRSTWPTVRARTTTTAITTSLPIPVSGKRDARRRAALLRASTTACPMASASTNSATFGSAPARGVEVFAPDGTPLGIAPRPRDRLQPHLRRSQEQPPVHHRHDLRLRRLYRRLRRPSARSALDQSQGGDDHD